MNIGMCVCIHWALHWSELIYQQTRLRHFSHLFAAYSITRPDLGCGCRCAVVVALLMLLLHFLKHFSSHLTIPNRLFLAFSHWKRRFTFAIENDFPSCVALERCLRRLPACIANDKFISLWSQIATLRNGVAFFFFSLSLHLFRKVSIAAIPLSQYEQDFPFSRFFLPILLERQLLLLLRREWAMRYFKFRECDNCAVMCDGSLLAKQIDSSENVCLSAAN